MLNKHFFSVILFFIIILVPSVHVPMHSDDYHYILKGMSINAEITHYLGWSGRVVADMISPFLLVFFPTKVIGIINAICLVSVSLLISAIPYALLKKDKCSWFNFSVIIMLYWIANPNLGQTSFWVVGAANYLWTNLFILIYLYAIASIQNDSKLNYSLVFLLSIIAGCSNENTSIIVVLISICHSIYLYKKNNLKFCFFGVIGSVIGASILLLSPGNYSRASTFPGWVDTPLQNKIADHFINRFEGTLQVYWQVYIVIAVFMIISACSTKDRHSRNHLVYSFIFLIFSIIANCAFALSPSIPDRALNGSLILTLISASFVFSSINVDDITGKILKIVILSFCAPIFLLSYYLFTNSLFANYYQSQIRVDMVVNDKKYGNNTAYIPSFYFTPLLKASDSIDYFHSPSMSSFFGLSYIGTYSPDFDYSQVRRAKFFKGPFVLNNELSIDKIFIYRDTVFSQYRLIAKFNKSTSLLSGNEIYLHINMDDGKVLIADLGNNSLWIDESNISQVPLGFINPEKIQSITYGIYTRQTMKRITERTTNIHGMLQSE